MTQATTDTPPAPSISEARFQRLVAKLRELFELDKSDLDFGIYRIMAAKNDEITAFLNRHLKETVEKTLAEHGADAADTVQTELDETIANLRKAKLSEEQIEASDGVKELRAKLASAGGASAEELQADIYNHLLNFFSRYYDEGDFISKRRYKGDIYAIPYSGEEVTLHWANKDQYYIKSGEWHKDYRFTVGSGKRVRFALVDATQETGNNKEPDESKRRYILVDENPVVVEGDTLTLRFHFRAPTDAETKRADDDAVAIYGGKYAGSKKGDERTRFCADAEQRALEHIPADWKPLVTAESPTDDKPERTILGKHLDGFTARNTFDYFIHKDLGGFLRRELDFYIKNEVVRLDDLDEAEPDHLRRVQGRVKAIRRVAAPIIDMLEATENFQKKLWLKKKFVLNTSWLVTVDRVPDDLRDIVAANKEQWAEWERLGFKPDTKEADGLFDGAKWGTRAYLDACDKLVVDTRLFAASFTSELLSSQEVLNGYDELDESVVGVLVNADNFHANTLLERYLQKTVDCVYIDPPYNAQSSEINYKNTFKHSAWLTLLDSRLSASKQMLNHDGVFVCAIDEVEQELLGRLLSIHFPDHAKDCIAVVHNPSGQQGDNFSFTHEYCYFLYPTPGRYIAEQVREDPDEWDERNFRDVTGDDSLREAGRNCFYAIYIKDKEVIGFGEVCPDNYHPGINEPGPDGSVAVYPIDPEGIERKWRFARHTVEAIADQLKPHYLKGRDVYDIKRLKKTFNYKSHWVNARYSGNNHGTQLLAQIVPDAGALYPKSVYTVRDAVHAALCDNNRGVVYDFFAGTGTTAHATMMLNREDEGARRVFLAEMGVHYNRVLHPRVAKTIYSPDWKQGQAQSHDQGLSALVKCFAVESYEDALNNLPTPGMLPAGTPDTMLRYALDLQLGPHLLDLEAFRDPWGYRINAQLAGDDEIKPHKVDLIETFNYLLGLKVSAYGRIEHYDPEFNRRKHDDELGGLKVEGRLRPQKSGRFVFQQVEGVLNDGADTRVLVVWRKLTEDAEQDAAVLEAWMERHRQPTTERSDYRDYHLIYINGPTTLPQPTQEIRTVLPIEEAFKQKMFEDTDGSV